MWVPNQDIEEKPYARFDGCRLYIIVDEILRVGLKNDNVTGA